MHHKRRYRYKQPILLVLLLLLTGCRLIEEKEPAKETSGRNHEEMVDIQAGQEDVKEKSIYYTLEGQNWKICDAKIAGTDNLYALRIEELSKEQAWVAAIVPYGHQFLILQENEQSQTKLLLINPLEMEVTAKLQLPAGMYNREGIRVNERQEIEIINLDTNELMVYDNTLQELFRYRIAEGRTDQIVLSGDGTYSYYLDYTDMSIYQQEIANGKRRKLFEDVLIAEDGFGKTIGLLGDDEYLAFCYREKAASERLQYEIRSIKDGALIYCGEEELSDIQSDGTNYLLRHYEVGLSEIVCGEEAGIPQVLSLKEYEEYEQIAMDIETQTVVTCQLTENAEVSYEEIVEKENGQALDVSQSVSAFTMNVYQLESGIRRSSMDFYYIKGEDEYISNCRGVYLEEGDWVICYVEGSSNSWFLWDLAADSSATGEDISYLRAWQNPDVPDTTYLEKLEEQAAELSNRYEVDIRMGKAVENCPKDIYRYEISNNGIRIEQALNLLEEELAKYPEGMLAKLGGITQEEGRLSIYLSGEIVPTEEEGIPSVGIENTIEGVTFVVLDIHQIQKLRGTLHHELYHAIEDNLDYNPEAFIDYAIWNSLNPEGFQYDFSYQENTGNQNYQYVVGNTEDAAYFVDTYSKSFPEEDRARLFEYAMQWDKGENKEALAYAPIQNKLSYLCTQIRCGFDHGEWKELPWWEYALVK